MVMAMRVQTNSNERQARSQRVNLQRANQEGVNPERDARYWQAAMARDARADGAFFFGVKSTQIYCRPSCPARRPLRKNTLFFPTPADAEREGFRPCQRCKPNEIPQAVQMVQRAAQVLKNDVDEAVSVGMLARKVGVP